jgi:hypothetical protein
MDSLIQRAWDLYQHTAGWPRETILTAAVWLEEKYRKTPRQRIALAIAIHYLILALRDDTSLDSALAREYCGRAARWRTQACAASGASLSAKTTEDNS